MSISNNFLEKKLYIITISEKELFDLINAGMSLSQASKYLAKKNNLSKSVIYKMY